MIISEKWSANTTICTEHSSIKAKPADVYKGEERAAGQKITYQEIKKEANRRPKFKKGDKVRLQRKKGTFEKGFRARWTQQVYRVSEVQKTMPITYKVEDLNGRQLPNSYHEPELLKAKQELFFIERVLDTKRINGRDYSLVRYSGFKVAKLQTFRDYKNSFKIMRMNNFPKSLISYLETSLY